MITPRALLEDLIEELEEEAWNTGVTGHPDEDRVVRLWKAIRVALDGLYDAVKESE